MRMLLLIIMLSSIAYAHSFSGTENVQVSFHTIPDTMTTHDKTVDMVFETFDKLGNRMTNIDYSINVTRDGKTEFGKSYVSEDKITLPYAFYNGSYTLFVRVSPSNDYNGDPFPAMTISYIGTVGKSASFAQGNVVVENNDTTLVSMFSFIIVAIGLFAIMKYK